MNLLSQLKSAIEPLVPVETGVFSDTAPEKYVVLTPLADTFDLHADNEPQIDVQAVRISLYDKGNYIKMKNQIVCAVLAAEMTITGRRYIGYESTTGYHHYAIDVAKHYEFKETEEKT